MCQTRARSAPYETRSEAASSLFAAKKLLEEVAKKVGTQGRLRLTESLLCSFQPVLERDLLRPPFEYGHASILYFVFSEIVLHVSPSPYPPRGDMPIAAFARLD